MLIRLTAIAGCALVFSGCTTRPSNAVSPEEFAKTAHVSTEARALRSGDEVQLAVEVNGNQEVQATLMEVDYTGSVPAPYIGDVQVAGLTLAEARLELEKHYAHIFVKKPLITFRLSEKESAGEWGYVTVLGQVRNPGRFPVETAEGMNLSDALHEAGGFGDSADMNEIVVSRKTRQGDAIQCVVDIKAIGLAGSSDQDVLLVNGDVVFVSERLF